MKPILLSILFTFQLLQARNIPFFLDSPNPNFYNESWLNSTAPSELGSNQNFPVDNNIKSNGLNSLQLKWKSVSGGNWIALVAAPNWVPVDITKSKYLTISIYSEKNIDTEKLPALVMEDIDNKKIEKLPLKTFLKEFSPDKWNEVIIPIKTLLNSREKIDFKNIKTVGFTQLMNDAQEHTINIDNLAFIENDDDNSIPAAPENLKIITDEKQISLNWEVSKSTNCHGYNIYFSKNGFDFQLKRQLRPADTIFTEKLSEENVKLYYKLTAFNTQYKESAFSKIVSDSIYAVDFKKFDQIVNSNENIGKKIPLNVNGYERHVSLKWNPVEKANGYLLYASVNGAQYQLRKQISKRDSFINDFIDSSGIKLQVHYKLIAYGSLNKLLFQSEPVQASTFSMTDEQLLDMVQEATFRYFWDFAHPVSGLARESNLHGPEICTIGGSGFGVMAIIIGIERGFISREEGLQRMHKIVDFLEKADRFHGAWLHWLNGSTGKVLPFSKFDDAGDLVETSFLIQGLLTVRQYFNNNSNAEEIGLYKKITHLWETVEWDWYRRNNEDVIYWHWSPDYDWKMNFPLHGYMETLITYILAIASPTHPIPAALYHKGWAKKNYRNPRIFYGYEMEVGPDYGGPLFWEHYSFLGFDPKNKKDVYTNYFRNSTAITLINREHCIRNPHNFKGYGKNCWGLTASFNPFGYSAQEPNNDNGTISPTAALSSIVYTPEYSMDVLKHFYRDLGSKIWGEYGFTDAFNETQDWYSKQFLAIDQGPIIDMIENYRTGLLWKCFMANREISPALEKIGFTPDTTNTPKFFPEKK